MEMIIRSVNLLGSWMCGRSETHGGTDVVGHCCSSGRARKGSRWVWSRGMKQMADGGGQRAQGSGDD